MPETFAVSQLAGEKPEGAISEDIALSHSALA